MNMIKVTMGFLELAAALKFFRTAELRWLTPPEYFTYDMVLALWVAILVAMALYLFGLFRTRHDHEMHDHVGPCRIMFALAVLGLAVYLMPALFGSRAARAEPAGRDRLRLGGLVPAAGAECGGSGRRRPAVVGRPAADPGRRPGQRRAGCSWTSPG